MRTFPPHLWRFRMVSLRFLVATYKLLDEISEYTSIFAQNAGKNLRNGSYCRQKTKRKIAPNTIIAVVNPTEKGTEDVCIASKILLKTLSSVKPNNLWFNNIQ